MNQDEILQRQSELAKQAVRMAKAAKWNAIVSLSGQLIGIAWLIYRSFGQ